MQAQGIRGGAFCISQIDTIIHLPLDHCGALLTGLVYKKIFLFLFQCIVCAQNKATMQTFPCGHQVTKNDNVTAYFCIFRLAFFIQCHIDFNKAVNIKAIREVHKIVLKSVLVPFTTMEPKINILDAFHLNKSPWTLNC